MKRGQAAGAAVLVAIIAAMILVFIVLVNPEERADILDGDTSGSGSGAEEIEGARARVNLLTESPGRIDFLAHNEIEHPLPTVNIFTKTESEIIVEKNSVYSARSVFSEEKDNFKFNLDSLERTENILLAFGVREVQGRLIVTLNGESIFNDEVAIGNPAPIKLPKNLLARQNELIFAISSPGVAFWATNKAVIENLKVVADVTEVEAQTSSHIFLVSETEMNNLEKVILKFQPDCKFDEVGMLKVTVNDNELYRAVPDCDLGFVPIEFSPKVVHAGENKIVFFTERGTYLLSHVVIESKLAKVDYPTYYFDLSHEQYEAVMNEQRRVRLQMDFVDVTSSKYGELVFNGYKNHFDTKEVNVAFDLSDDVVKGTNSVKIKPRKTIEVRQVSVDLVE
jgi:hypothetical protein